MNAVLNRITIEFNCMNVYWNWMMDSSIDQLIDRYLFNQRPDRLSTYWLDHYKHINKRTLSLEQLLPNFDQFGGCSIFY